MKNRNFKYIRSLIIGSIFGAIVMAGTAVTISAQNNVNDEYRDWQRAQARAQQEHQDYLRTHSIRDYNQWQAAQRRAQEQYRQYQMAANRYNNGYSYGNYNNGNYNNGYNNGYNNNIRRYRIYRNGSYYSTDYRGAELLRQAVRNGYSKGYRQGQIDSQYGRSYNYGDERMYRSGTYGYQSYVDRNQYQYYFQQGFQKGYEDGFYSQTQYGYRQGNSFTILGSVLNTILNLAQDND